MAEIRRAHQDEMAALAALRWRWVNDKADGVVLPELADFTADFLTWAAANRESHIPFVALEDAEPVGMAWLAVQERVPSPRAVERISGDLQSCYVVPERRGNGVGRALVHRVLVHASALGCEHVTVHASLESLRMYPAAGFRNNPRALWADSAVFERS